MECLGEDGAEHGNGGIGQDLGESVCRVDSCPSGCGCMTAAREHMDRQEGNDKDDGEHAQCLHDRDRCEIGVTDLVGEDDHLGETAWHATEQAAREVDLGVAEHEQAVRTPAATVMHVAVIIKGNWAMMHALSPK